MRTLKRLIKLLLFLVIIIAALVVGGGYGKYKQAIGQLPIEEAAEKIKNTENFTSFSEISPTFVKAMVAVEDRRFYKHKGVDVIGIGRAFKKNLKEKRLVEGGSCITQQLAKNIYFMSDNSFSRKIAEVIIALNIEKQYTKNEILELYLNVIYYGSGYYGVGEATEGYFSKTPSQLDDREATLLAGIPNAPSIYSLDNNPALARKRQKTVIDAMVEMKYLTEKEAAEILTED